MSRVQRVQGDLTLDPSGSINLNSNTTVNGNLTVVGTTTTVSSTDTSVKDRVITLNDGEAGAGVTGRYSGLEFDRGSVDNAFLVFDENDDSLKFSTDNGSTYVGLLTGSGAGITAVVDDTTPQLGGNLDVNGQTILAASGNVPIEGNVQINNSLGVPSAVADAVVVYSAAPGSAGSGLYIQNSSVTGDELVTKSKAIVFSLIL